MIHIYCQTSDDPKKVGELICRANSNGKEQLWKVKEEIEPDTWTIETHCDNYAHAIVCRIGDSIVAIEVNIDCAPNIIEPLMEKYGFEKVKWLITK